MGTASLSPRCRRLRALEFSAATLFRPQTSVPAGRAPQGDGGTATPLSSFAGRARREFPYVDAVQWGRAPVQRQTDRGPRAAPRLDTLEPPAKGLM